MKVNGLDKRYQAASLKRLSAFVLLPAMILTALAMARQNADPNNTRTERAQETKRSHNSIGFIFSQDASASDVGLPVYPGAQRSNDTSDDSSALQMGLWGPSSGFKLVVLKLDSNDAPERVAAFYRKALGRYGRVLDCAKSASRHEKAGSRSNALDCEADQPVDGGFTLKAGTKDKQHVVGVEPRGSHSRIALVYVEAPGSGNQQD